MRKSALPRKGRLNAAKGREMAKRRNYIPEFKARGLVALANEKTVAELSSEFGIHQNFVNNWNAPLGGETPDVY